MAEPAGRIGRQVLARGARHRDRLARVSGRGDHRRRRRAACRDRNGPLPRPRAGRLARPAAQARGGARRRARRRVGRRQAAWRPTIRRRSRGWSPRSRSAVPAVVDAGALEVLGAVDGGLAGPAILTPHARRARETARDRARRGRGGPGRLGRGGGTAARCGRPAQGGDDVRHRRLPGRVGERGDALARDGGRGGTRSRGSSGRSSPRALLARRSSRPTLSGSARPRPFVHGRAARLAAGGVRSRYAADAATRPAGFAADGAARSAGFGADGGARSAGFAADAAARSAGFAADGGARSAGFAADAAARPAGLGPFTILALNARIPDVVRELLG